MFQTVRVLELIGVQTPNMVLGTLLRSSDGNDYYPQSFIHMKIFETNLGSWSGPRSYIRMYLVLKVGKCL